MATDRVASGGHLLGDLGVRYRVLADLEERGLEACARRLLATTFWDDAAAEDAIADPKSSDTGTGMVRSENEVAGAAIDMLAELSFPEVTSPSAARPNVANAAIAATTVLKRISPRLRRNNGKREEARELLAPVYGWFTEGFDTRDLKEAKALMEELAA